MNVGIEFTLLVCSTIILFAVKFMAVIHILHGICTRMRKLIADAIGVHVRSHLREVPLTA